MSRSRKGRESTRTVEANWNQSNPIGSQKRNDLIIRKNNFIVSSIQHGESPCNIVAQNNGNYE